MYSIICHGPHDKEQWGTARKGIKFLCVNFNCPFGNKREMSTDRRLKKKAGKRYKKEKKKKRKKNNVWTYQAREVQTVDTAPDILLHNIFPPLSLFFSPSPYMRILFFPSSSHPLSVSLSLFLSLSCFCCCFISQFNL